MDRKRYILILGLAAALSLMGCSGRSASQNNTDRMVDWNQNYYTSSYKKFIYGSESGYYIATGEFLYYLDEGQDEAVLLCGKINCPHEDENCNGYFFQESPQIIYDNGKLYGFVYTVQDNCYHLTELSADGETRRQLFSVSGLDTNHFIIHRGVVYYVIHEGKYEKIMAYDINRDKEAMVYLPKYEAGMITSVFCEDDKLYFGEAMIGSSDEWISQWKCCSLTDGSILEMKFSNQETAASYADAALFHVKDGQMYLFCADKDAQESLDIICCNMDGGSAERILQAPMGLLAMDDQYIYLFEWSENTLLIYNEQGSRVQTLSFEESEGERIVSGVPVSGDAKYAFLQLETVNTENNKMKIELIRISKAEIESLDIHPQTVLYSSKD